MMCRALSLALFCVICSYVSGFAQKPELVVQTGHNTDFILNLAFSPDGKILATAGFLDRNIKLWHIETGKELASFLEPQGLGLYLGLQWQKDTLHSLSKIGRTSKFSQWSLKERKLLNTKISKTTQFSRNGSYHPQALFFCYGADSSQRTFKNMQGKDSLAIMKDSVVILETATGNVRAVLPQSGKTTAQFSPDGKFLLTIDNTERLSLWDATTFQRLHTTTLPATKINGARWSPNSQFIAIGVHDTTLCLLNVATNQVIATMNGHSGEIQDIVFSPDGQRLFTVSNDSTLKLWDAQKGTFLKTLAKFSETTASVAVSPDGRTLALTTYPAQRIVYILDAETGIIKHILRGGSLGVFPTITPNILGNGTFLTRKDIPVSLQQAKTDNSEILRYWDFAAIAEPVRRITKQLPQSQTDIFRTIRDTLIACEYNQQTLVVWNPTNRTILQRFSFPPPNAIRFAAVSNNKTMVAVMIESQGNDDEAKDILITLDCRTGKELWRDSSYRFMGRMGGISMMFGQNDSLLITLPFERRGRGLHEYTAGYQARTGKKMFYFQDTFSATTDSIHLSLFKRKDTTINLQTLRRERYDFPLARGMEIIRMENDMVLARKPSGDTIAFSIALQREVHSRFFGFTFTRDGKFAFNADNAAILIADAHTGRDLANLYTLDSTNWAVTTPDGRFDGSEGGLRYLHFVVENEPIELEQLKERYYEPGLLSKLMGYNNEPLRTIERFDSVKLYPRVSLQLASPKATNPKNNVPKKQSKSTKENSRGLGGNEQNISASPSAQNLTFFIQLTNQGGGIGRVPVWLNGKELTDDARPKNTRADVAEMSLTLNLEGNRLLLPGTTNTLTVRAFNGENGVVSRSTTLEFYAPGERLQSAPHLYAVIGGTSDYQGEELDLPFASSDAEQIAKAVQIAGERLLGADRVHITLLTANPDSTKSLTRTTKANLVNALKAVQQKATPNDILFVYLTGHGINWGGQDGDWYYLTCDARLGDDEKFTDAALRTSVALSSHELTDLMKAIPARKQTLALDACASGKAVENLLASRDVPSSQLRAMMRMKDRAGLHVISGCASNAVSYEASRYGQGLLTYSLLMGMKGGALRDNQFVDVKQLFEFAADRVPELARDIGRLQKPQVCSPFGGGSFDIGLVTEAEAKSIPLADAKPLFVRANFQDEKKMYDHLNLGKLVNESLRGVTYRAAVNPFEAWLVYLDVPEFPNSYSVNGRYTIKGEDITVSAVLRKGEEEGTVFSIKGTTNNLATLAKTLIAETQKRMK